LLPSGEETAWWRRVCAPNTFAVQCRINSEQVTPTGVFPAAENSVVNHLQVPTGSGIRTETAVGRGDYSPNPLFDSLLALLVVKTSNVQDFAEAVENTKAKLQDFAVVGTAPTNIELVNAVLSEPGLGNGTLHTRFIDENLSKPGFLPVAATGHGSDCAPRATADSDGLVSPMKAVVVDVLVKVGDVVQSGDPLVILSALKMEHELRAPYGGIITAVNVSADGANEVNVGQTLVIIDKDSKTKASADANADYKVHKSVQLTDKQQQMLTDYQGRVNFITKDESRPKKTQRGKGRLTARQIISRLIDDDTEFLEYGKFGHEAGKPDAVADSIITGIAVVNGARVALCVYDYTVLAGTQGFVGHSKMDRLFELCHKQRLPLMLLPEGGGGRAGNYAHVTSGLHAPGFTLMAQLSGHVPIVGGVSGLCFAGNAALLGTCDLIVGTTSPNATATTSPTSIGMGGPAMIEGGGLGKVHPEAVGPVEMHYKNGIVDFLASTDEEMVQKVKSLMTMFTIKQTKAGVAAPDGAEDKLRAIIPDNRKRSFPMRDIISNVFDTDSVIELRRSFGPAVITGFARINGRSVGYIANDCMVLSGAIDAAAAQKMTQFLTICNAHNMPVVSFCDTPGFLVGVEAEKEGLVKRSGELFIAGAKLNTPLIAIVVRRGYGLGAMAMCGGSLKRPALTAAWYTAEFGAMGIEGAIQLGFRDQIKDNPAKYRQLVEIAYDRGKAYTIASMNEFDEVIDPAMTRKTIIQGLDSFTRQ
jgi:acetyl-CoA carboxylase carboxyltransferase component/biotin carboxyl carrier protein